MLDLGSSWDRQHDWRSSQQPYQSHLRWSSFPSPGYAADGAVCTGDAAGSQRKPGNETQFLLFAIFQNIFRSSISNAVTILNAHNRNNLARMLNLLHAYFRQAN